MASARSSIDTDLLLAQAGWVQALARKLVHDRERADDVAQEALLAALERPPLLAANERSLRAWLARVVRSVVHVSTRGDERRRYREVAAARAAGRTESSDPAAEAIERAAQLRRVVDTLMRLEEPYRATLLMAYVDGLSAGEIAERLEVSPVAVRKRLSRGLQRLRSSFDEQYDGDREAWMAAIAPLAGLAHAGAPAAATSGIGAGSASLKLATALLAAGLGAALWPEGAELASRERAEPGVLALAGEAPSRGPGAGPSSAEDPLELRAPQGRLAWLAVRVVERGTQRALPGVSIQIAEDQVEAVRALEIDVESDMDGWVRAEVPSGIVLDLTAFGQAQHCETRREVLEPLAAGSARTVVLALATDYERTVVGRVLDESGRPVAGADVRSVASLPRVAQGEPALAVLDGAAYADAPVLAQADREGRFRVRVPERPFALHVSAPAQAPAFVAVASDLAFATDDEPALIELGRAAELAGRVEAAEGGPLAAARVELSFAPEGAGAGIVEQGAVLRVLWSQLADAHGRVRFQGLPLELAGTVAVRAPHGALIAADQLAELESGERRSLCWVARALDLAAAAPLAFGEVALERELAAPLERPAAGSAPREGELFAQAEPGGEKSPPQAPSAGTFLASAVSKGGGSLGGTLPDNEHGDPPSVGGSTALATWSPASSDAGESEDVPWFDFGAAGAALAAAAAAPSEDGFLGPGALACSVLDAAGAPVPLAALALAGPAPCSSAASTAIAWYELDGALACELAGLPEGTYAAQLCTVAGQVLALEELSLGAGLTRLEWTLASHAEPAPARAAGAALSGAPR